MVTKDEWLLSGELEPHRLRRLLEPLAADQLVEALGQEADAAAAAGRIELDWEPCEELSGYIRLFGQIPVSQPIFDQLFNGQSGYRAHYFESIEAGENYNRLVIQRLTKPLIAGVGALSFDQGLAGFSLGSLHSKIWVGNEKTVFNAAPPYQLVPVRWVQNGAYLGCRAPLPVDCIVDVKGTFVHPETRQTWVDPLKLDRSRDLFDKGYT